MYPLVRSVLTATPEHGYALEREVWKRGEAGGRTSGDRQLISVQLIRKILGGGGR
jgi:hypothetical protein